MKPPSVYLPTIGLDAPGKIAPQAGDQFLIPDSQFGFQGGNQPAPLRANAFVQRLACENQGLIGDEEAREICRPDYWQQSSMATPPSMPTTKKAACATSRWAWANMLKTRR